MDVQQHAEDGFTHHVGQWVQRLDYENDGTPRYCGKITRIEINDSEVTYWITWDGAQAPDPHGLYAFEATEPDADDAMAYASEHYSVDMMTLTTSPESGAREFTTPFGTVWLNTD